MHNPVSFRSKTKIVATLGPRSASTEVIMDMLDAGMTVARFNMSHGSHEEHAQLMHTARLAAKKAKRPLAILQDLSGPKIRIGDFETETVTLEEGAELTLTTVPCTGTHERVWVNYKKLPQEVAVGMTMFLNDGKIMLKVLEIGDTDIRTTVQNGGVIRGRRGVNVPDGNLSISSLTPKDRKDLVFGLEHEVDFVTLSFVRSAQDIHTLRKLIGPERKVMIVAKIETKNAIDAIDEIIAAADAIMVARGDLAIEVPAARVPLLQKRIIQKANHAGKPVITATQMLDSMRNAPVPTRAEVNDVANAILDGTDAVMLSDESAIGDYPARAVRTMSRIAHETENDPLFAERTLAWDFPPRTTCDAVSRSIVQAIPVVKACAVVAFSESGHTGRMVARYRPLVPILVLTPHQKTYNRSLITYACEPVLVHAVKQLADAQKMARKALLMRGLTDKGDTYILGAGIPFGAPGSTNLMLVETV
ncbi:MAG: pyruvate kinase [Candidatus Pacebacteria bacterium]|nr:pyruvate kinase [Candidatus Paceibacterota bacterium]